MTVQLQRRLLTARVRTALTAVQVDGADLLVGDHVIPVSAGWQGNPQQIGAKYLPYVVLTALTATQFAGGPAAPQGDWWMPYAIQSFSALPDAVQWMADQTREAVAGLKGEVIDLGPAHYKIDFVRTDQFGGVSRVGQGSATYYGIQDGVSLSLRRQRS